MHRFFPFAAGLVTVAVLAAGSTSAGAAQRVQLLQVGAWSMDGVPVTLRCVSSTARPCAVNVEIDGREGAGGRAVKLGTRKVTVRPGVLRVVTVGMSSPRNSTRGPLRATVSGPGIKSARRRSDGLTPSTGYDRSSLPLVTAFDPSPSSDLVKVQIRTSDACTVSVSLAQLVQDSFEIRMGLVVTPLVREGMVCGQATTDHCVAVQLSGRLGARSVWSIGQGTPVSPRRRNDAFRINAQQWKNCPTLAAGQSVTT